MKLECLWILTNLAYGTEEEVRKILTYSEINVIGILDAVLKDLNDYMAVEQCLWFIGNITGDSSTFRDVLLNNTCLVEALTRLVTSPNLTQSLMKTICWVTTNLTRFKGLPP
jgi:hypothetical protein